MRLSVPLLLALRHGLEVLQEQPLAPSPTGDHLPSGDLPCFTGVARPVFRGHTCFRRGKERLFAWGLGLYTEKIGKKYAFCFSMIQLHIIIHLKLIRMRSKAQGIDFLLALVVNIGTQ